VTARILFVEVPGFYAEVERVARSDLADRPVIVGGDPRKRGLVQAATADARAAGVRIGMPVVEALGRCLRARAVRTDMPRYRDADKRLRACLRHVCDRIEPAGLGAAYLDARETPGEAAMLADALREAVRRELGLPLRIGAAPTRALARIAAAEAGAAGFVCIERREVADFLAPLPVARLPGVGPNTEARLAELGARTVGELVALGRGPVESALGNHGLAILATALGQGDERIRAARPPQTLSQEATFAADEVDRAVLVARLRGLAERLERGLALEGLVARRVVLKVRHADGRGATRSLSLDRGLAAAGELLAVAETLLARTDAGGRPVRGLGLAATILERRRDEDRQLSLFDR
jgi:DNA polymerase-4